jgi:hypothetical protein
VVDTITGGSYWIFHLETQIMLQDPEFQQLMMALLSFVIGWFFKRPQDLMKKQ